MFSIKRLNPNERSWIHPDKFDSNKFIIQVFDNKQKKENRNQTHFTFRLFFFFLLHFFFFLYVGNIYSRSLLLLSRSYSRQIMYLFFSISKIKICSSPTTFSFSQMTTSTFSLLFFSLSCESVLPCRLELFIHYLFGFFFLLLCLLFLLQHHHRRLLFFIYVQLWEWFITSPCPFFDFYILFFFSYFLLSAIFLLKKNKTK